MPALLPNRRAGEEEAEDADDLAGSEDEHAAMPEGEDDFEEDDDAFLAPTLAPPGTASGSAAGAAPSSAAAAAAAEDRAMLTSRIDPTAWRMELERVAPRLRITVGADAKDWRSHLELAHEHRQEIERAWPEASGSLEKLGRELGMSIDKLLTRERFLNEQFEGLMQSYKGVRSQLISLQETYNKKSERVSERNNEMHRLAEQLEEMKRVMDERGSNISDTSPVVRIKTAIKKLQQELGDMEVRIGVVQHQLMSVTMRDKLRVSKLGVEAEA